MADAIDLLQLDRDVRKASSLSDLPTELRYASTQSTYRALVAAKVAAHDVQLRDGLLRWVHELLQARVAADLRADEEEALNAVDDRLSKSTRPEQAEAGIPRTFAEAWTRAIAAPDPVRAEAALDRAADLAAPVAAVRKELRERRFEAARRLGLTHPNALASNVDVAASARALLDSTEPLAIEIRRDTQKKSDVPWRASSAMQLALARDAREGWPARPLSRWLDDVFKPLVPRGLRVKGLPAALGGATFLRAAMAFGVAWKHAAAPRSMPFAIARDPYPVPAHRLGFALASAVSDPTFQRRALELPARIANAQARILRRSAFLHARVTAARAILATSEHVDASLFEELTARAFGAPLPAALRDAWPAIRIDDPARFVALLSTPSFVARLVDRFDDDWFRNPKAGTHLTSLACGPAFDVDSPPLDDAPRTFARLVEELLG